ncbi:MAG: DNA translocase FtsK [Oscillospiraceae bacterium]|nr:DNA translocase FtsK [Oscillospiraceae bacterium]
MHELIKGLFGLTSLLIPAGLCWTAMQIDKKKEKDKLGSQIKFMILVIVFLSCFIEILFFGGRLLNYEFFGCFKMLREEGIAWRGCGMVSALAYPIQAIFGEVGAKIMMIAVLAVSVMLISKKSLSDLFQWMKKPFRGLGDFFLEDRRDFRLISGYEQEQSDHEEQNEREALAIARQSGEIKQLPDKNQFSIDIPIGNVPRGIPSEQSAKGMEEFFEMPAKDTKVKVRKKSRKAETSSETEENQQLELVPSLEDLINQAVDSSRKKKKQDEALDAVLDIDSEIEKNSGKVQKMSDDYQMPKLSFLNASSSEVDVSNLGQELRNNADRLREVLKSFNVEVEINDISRGPSVTRYEVKPAKGVKVSKITSLSDDIALNLAAEGVRIEAPIPGKPAVGIEVPNAQKDTVSLRELLESPQFRNAKSKLTFGVGKDIAGNVIIGDIAKMPHMIIAGATGSGKSVCTNSIIMSILYHAAPDEVKLILIDPKIVEFRVYDGIPHLLIPVVTDPKKAAGALNWAVQEMLRRYDVFAKNAVRNLEDYNRICIEKPELQLDKMPQIVICIDELADLMMTASKEVEEAICRLAQLARAAGMHLIIATQRPTTDIITGLIKANIPSRIALSVMSQIDSRIILDTGGAEKLLGHGDMLYLPSGQPKPVRVQGCYVSTQEIEKVVEFIKNQSEDTGYDEAIEQAVNQMAVSGDKKKGSSEEIALSGDEDLIEQAIEVVVSAGQASTSNLQRRLRLGYARAARIMDELEEKGIIGPYEGAKPRKVLLSPLELEQRKMHQKGK